MKIHRYSSNYGAAGDSKTGGHHILSLAESMKRGLAPDFVIAQASNFLPFATFLFLYFFVVCVAHGV